MSKAPDKFAEAIAHSEAKFAELRQEMKEGDAALKQEIAELRQEMRDGFAAVDIKLVAVKNTMLQYIIIGLFIALAGFMYALVKGFV